MMISFLDQVAVTLPVSSHTETKDILNFLLESAKVLVLPFIGYLAAKFKKLREAIEAAREESQKQNKELSDKIQHLEVVTSNINVTLVGQSGNNGMMSRINRLEHWRDEVSQGNRKIS